jgi:hypothetical protein
MMCLRCRYTHYTHHSEQEQQLLWSMIDDDDGGTIDRAEFVAFFTGRTLSASHISDRLRGLI